MSSRKKQKYTAVPLQEIVVVKNPAEQPPNGTEHSPSRVVQQPKGNEVQSSSSKHSPSSVAEQPKCNKSQPSTSNKRPNSHKQELIITEQPVNVCTELHSACKILDYERVSILLDQSSDVNALDEQWLTPLDVVGENATDHKSQIESFLLVIEALVREGGKPTFVKDKAKYRETPLHVAVKFACEGCEGCDVCSQCLKAINILVGAGYKEPLMNKGSQKVYVKGAPKSTDKEIYTSLHAAVLKKWLGGVEALLRHGADVNARVAVPVVKNNGNVEKHKRGENVLHAAVHKQWHEGVTLLLGYKADINATLSVYAGGYTSLHMAAQRLDFRCLELLLEANADPNALDSQKLTPLDVVGEKYTNNTVECFLRVIKALIDRNGKPTSIDNPKYRETPIHVAVRFQSCEAIRILYDNGYKYLLPNKTSNTPLHMVASQRSHGYLDLLVSLYKENSGLDARNKEGETALHIAVKNMWLEGVKTLLAHGADITIKTHKEKTVLHLLPQKRNYVVLKELLSHEDKHKIVNEKDRNGNLPLFLAIFANHAKCVFLLVEANADLTQKHGKDKRTVLHSAVVGRNAQILNGLFKYDKISTDKIKDCTMSTNELKNATALHIAVFTNSPECVKILVENKCNLEAKTEYEDQTFTAFELATMKGYDEVLKELLKGDSSLVNKPDAMGMMPIHRACIQQHSKAIKVITDAGCDLSAKCDHEGDKSKNTAMDLFINRVPGSVDLMEGILNSAITVNKERIEFDYKILLPDVKGNSKPQLKVIDALVQSGDQVNQGRLFTHPVIETFLRLQWERIRKLYICFISAFVLLIAIPFHVLLMIVFYFEHSLSDFPLWATIIHVSMGLGFVIYITHEILYFAFKTWNSRYFCHWELSKEVFLFIIHSVRSMLIISIISIVLFLPFTNPQEKFFRELAICGSIMLCLQLMLLISRVPTYGIYMQMFFKVTSNLFIIMLSFTIIFFSFVMAFLVGYRGAAPFNSIPEAFLKSLVMMTSEIEYASLFGNIEKDTIAFTFCKVVFVIFLFLVGVVIMNIVLGKAILDVKKVDQLRYQAKFLSTYEQILLFCEACIAKLNASFGHCITGSSSMKATATETKLYIRFDKANRFNNTLMQSIMKKVFMVCKSTENVPKEDDVNKKLKLELNKINVQLDGIMETNKMLIETNKMLIESINSINKKLRIEN